MLLRPSHHRLPMIFSGLDKLLLSVGDLDPSSNTWLFWPTRVSPQNGMTIGLAVSAQHICVTNRQTDIQTTLRAAASH